MPAKLHASGFLPEVWIPNEKTEALRRRIAERNQLVSQMTRRKNHVHSVLHANLIPRYAGKRMSGLESFAAPMAITSARTTLRNRSGSLAILAAIRRVSSRLSSLAADRRPDP